MSNIKIITKGEDSPGKNVVILAGVHGKEVCGVKAFNELLPTLKVKQGKVTFIYANLQAQKQNKRFIEKNLNRCFLNKPSKEMLETLEGKTAQEIIPYLKEADAALDLHSSPSSDSLKFLICEKDCLDLITALSPKRVILGIDDVQKGSTDGYMFNEGKPGICIECGLHEAEDSVETAKEAILNFLKKMEVIEGKAPTYNEKELYKVAYLYWNKNGPFKLSRKFKDFGEIKEKTLIGYDGLEEIYVEEGDVIMFPDEPKEVGKECFVVIRKESI